MKKIALIISLLVSLFISCGTGSSKSDSEESNDSTKVDSLKAYFHKIDSLKNNGQLFHLDIYEIGKLGSIYFDVYNITSGGDSAQYLNLKKDCGGEYYYDWEDAILVEGEIKYLLAAVDTVLANFDRACNHEERYVYITKDDIRLFSSAWEDHNWSASLSVDYQKKDASVKLGKEDLQKLKKLLIEGEKKITLLSKGNNIVEDAEVTDTISHKAQ